MSFLLQDLRYGWRALAKNPGFTVAAVLTLALGIGANTAILSVINTVLLQPLPYKNADRLTTVWRYNHARGYDTDKASPLDFAYWRSQNHVFESMAASPEATNTLTGGGSPTLIIVTGSAARGHGFAGAVRGDLLKLVVGEGMRLALLGVGLGIVGALALTRYMSSMLYGVQASDLYTLVGVSLLLTAVAAMASYIPARKATRVDPMVALRYE